MNTPQTLTIFDSAGVVQDKTPSVRLSAASDQPLTPDDPALKEKKKHSTKRKKVFAGAWVDLPTDAYIVHRTNLDPKHSRSKALADMLKERAQGDVFEKNQELLVPIIQQTIRSELRLFTTMFMNRFLALIARSAYQVSQIRHILLTVIALAPFIDEKTLHDIEDKSETAARVHITTRTPQVDEVMRRLRQDMEETTSGSR